MDVYTVIIAVAVMSGLGFSLASILAVANKKLYVFEDPRIDQVDGMLPGSNCGACGLPGCRAFAEAVVAGTVTPGGCTATTEESQDNIADYLGVDVGGEEKQVARLACAGGTNVARQRAAYEGIANCRGANLVAGGGKGCAWGCLGYDDCMVVCDFDAIVMNEFGLPVVDENLCTACGDCVEICPKGLFSLQPISNRLWVACKNESFGDDAENECAVACNACAKCPADAPEGLIKMINNLAVVDHSKQHLANKQTIQRCPTGAIVWLTSGGGVIKGNQAKRIVRHSPLPIG
jgi:Na+-translocating ferredoxin:NAD+ oxidoreductase RNF subunit RnfB